ncbi:MAG: hypothetical protein JST12_19345 [Armatimonadetes bacterium]|nr:hypothetical protein [Armatimonadota bacterium]
MKEAALLDLWERSAGMSPVERSLVLASFEGSVESGAPLGRVAGHVLDLRSRLFGRRFELMSACPECGEPAEVEFAANQLPTPTSEDQTVEVAMDGYRVLARPANSLDVAYLLRFDEVEVAELALRKRCTLMAEYEGVPVELESIPTTVWAAVEDALDALDPLAAAGVNLQCPTCSTEWRAQFDVTAIVYRELSIHARGILGQVDALARAYGWTEDAVLALSPARRRSYLDMVKA